jgi:hypothetical protein
MEMLAVGLILFAIFFFLGKSQFISQFIRDYRIRHAPTFEQLFEEAQRGEREGWIQLDDPHDLRLSERPTAVLATGRMRCEIWRRTGNGGVPHWTFVAWFMDMEYEWTVEYLGGRFISADVGGSKMGSDDLPAEEFVRLGAFAYHMVRTLSA